jgi:hypothetical protein
VKNGFEVEERLLGIVWPCVVRRNTCWSAREGIVTSGLQSGWGNGGLYRRPGDWRDGTQ